MLPFNFKESRQANPSQVPQQGPYGEKYPLTGHFYLASYISFYLSLRVPGKRAPSMFPNRVPMDSGTPSPEPLVYILFFRSFVYVSRSPQKGTFLHTYGEKYRVIHKSLRDFRTRLRNNQDRHGRKEHINR